MRQNTAEDQTRYQRKQDAIARAHEKVSGTSVKVQGNPEPLTEEYVAAYGEAVFGEMDTFLGDYDLRGQVSKRDSPEPSDTDEAPSTSSKLKEMHKGKQSFPNKVMSFFSKKREGDLEAKYAKKELEHERELAMNALEQSKMSTNVQVQMNTAAGTTVSGGSAVSQHTEVHHEEHKEKKSLTDKIKSLF